MSTKIAYTCDGCGAAITDAQAAQFAGMHFGQTGVAASSVTAWHSCGWQCATRHLRDVAEKVEARGKALDAQRAAYEADQKARAAEQAALQATGPGTRAR